MCRRIAVYGLKMQIGTEFVLITTIVMSNIV